MTQRMFSAYGEARPLSSSRRVCNSGRTSGRSWGAKRVVTTTLTACCGCSSRAPKASLNSASSISRVSGSITFSKLSIITT